jgi:hypothetical protein
MDTARIALPIDDDLCAQASAAYAHARPSNFETLGRSFSLKPDATSAVDGFPTFARHFRYDYDAFTAVEHAERVRAAVSETFAMEGLGYAAGGDSMTPLSGWASAAGIVPPGLWSRVVTEEEMCADGTGGRRPEAVYAMRKDGGHVGVMVEVKRANKYATVGNQTMGLVEKLHPATLASMQSMYGIDVGVLHGCIIVPRNELEQARRCIQSDLEWLRSLDIPHIRSKGIVIIVDVVPAPWGPKSWAGSQRKPSRSGKRGKKDRRKCRGGKAGPRPAPPLQQARNVAA